MKCPKCNCELELKAVEDRPRSASEPDHLGLKELLDRIDEDELDSAAGKFVRETKERFEQYGNRTRISEKQMAWLEKIADGANRKDDWQ